MKRFHFFIGCLLVLFTSNIAQGQSVENVNIKFSGDRVIITYDLNSPEENQKFKVSVYSSHNNYRTPLSRISGDIGDEIISGKQKQVTWDVTRELPSNFNDDLTIKVRAAAIINPNYTITPMPSNAFKRGSNLELKWQGGRTSEQIKVDLLKNNILQQTLSQTQNTHSYNWQIPKKHKPGNEYALRISSATNPNNNSTTDYFKIKPKIPMYLKIGVPVIIGVVVGVLVGGKDSGGEQPSTNNELSELPGPLNPPGG